jgi:hypothetical protein
LLVVGVFFFLSKKQHGVDRNYLFPPLFTFVTQQEKTEFEKRHLLWKKKGKKKKKHGKQNVANRRCRFQFHFLDGNGDQC